MDCSVIPRILEELNLDEKDVTNIYHYGSWVYGTNSPTSDRDLLIVTHSSDRNSLKFWTDFDYFHDFKCHKLWGQYDITVYTVENFEMLLEKSYLIAVQCVYLPDEFKLKNEIDYRRIYLEKYFNPLRIKQAAFYEMYRDWKLYKPENNSNGPSEKQLSWRNYVFKHFFHGLRYLDFVEQLIQTQSIYNYKRVTCILDEMKDIRGDPTDNSGMKR
jgi:predicted nucleotidyltransferase